jgi:hypothetical protein
MKPLCLTIVTLLLAACGGGELDIKLGDSGVDPVRPDTGALPNNSANTLNSDMGTPPGDMSGPNNVITSPDMTDPLDMAPPPMCDPADCGSGASCQNNVCTCDDGLFGNPLEGCSPMDPCANVSCPAGSSCNPDGTCSCDPFFSGDVATGCVPTPPAADLSARSNGDVCAIWEDQYQRSSQDFFLLDPVDECDPGRLHPEELRQALHTTSRYRMLVGLHPVSLAAGRIENTQQCATMHEATNQGLNHTPPNTWTCFTQEGYSGCSSSNLAGGIRSPAGTVGLYVADNGIASLGHRRWVLNPRMGATAFGHRGQYGAMYAFDTSRSHNPDFVAYPAPGPFPRAAIGGKWSIHGGGSYSDQHVVTVTNMGDGSDVPVSNITAPVFGNLASTLSWTVSTGGLPLETTYRVTINDSGGALVREYDTTLIACP